VKKGGKLHMDGKTKPFEAVIGRRGVGAEARLLGWADDEDAWG